jgi:hypothetical protein
MPTRPGSTPADPSIGELFRQQKRQTAGFFVVLLCGLLVLGYVANKAATASEENVSATQTQFASQARSACITDRRSIQNDELGQMSVHTLRALDALARDDRPTFTIEAAAGLAASLRWEIATAQLAPDVLSQPTPEGCGPPVTSSEQVDTTDSTTP